MRAAFVIPAYQAADTVGLVLDELGEELALDPAGHIGIDARPVIIVVDDGSLDGTSREAEDRGATVLFHRINRGKGAAIVSGLREAARLGCDCAITLDADAQHPAHDAYRLLDPTIDTRALVLGVRTFDDSGAPRANVIANRISNFFLSWLTYRKLRDTQCGLRRYPIADILALGACDPRFGFESEIILHAVWGQVPIVEVPVHVRYPPRSRRASHFRAVVDTIRIALRIIATVFSAARPHRGPGSAPRRLARLGKIALAVAALCACAHLSIVTATKVRPPAVTVPADPMRVDPIDADLRRVPGGYARHHGRILEVALSGSPEEIGAYQMRLLRPELLEMETHLWHQLDRFVPFSPAQTVIFDIARLRYRSLPKMVSSRYLREIAANALAFQPDPFARRVDTFQRMLYLHALYDISLSFEGSPLVGCTSFALSDGVAADDHVMLARNFDFEAGDQFDRGKAVFFIRETGRIPYASVSWPGLVGAVTGMNAAGLALVVHGGRARKPSPLGEPLVHTMRDVLGEAHNIDEAIRIFQQRGAMVSHMVMLADRTGNLAVVERAPGEAPFVRRGRGKLALSNHFEGPLRDDPANLAVRARTSTVGRRARLDERLAELPTGSPDGQSDPTANQASLGATVADAIAILRDRRAPGGAPLSVGDRSAIDADIATHAVVMDVTAGILWVGEGPHLSGRFLRFDTRRLLDEGYRPESDRDTGSIE